MSSDVLGAANSPRRVIRGSSVQDGFAPVSDPVVAGHEGRASELAARPGAMLIDYLRAVLPDTRQTWDALAGWLGPMEGRQGGWHGWYDRSYAVLDGGIVAYCADPGKGEREGVLVDLPGAACGALGDRLGPFVGWVRANGHLTRLDFAWDDRQGHLTQERVVGGWRERHCVTPWRKGKVVVDLEHGKGEAWTLYMGRRAGRAMVRVYDKAAQQGIDGPWVRFEFEAHDDLANNLAGEYFRRGAGAVIEQVNRYIRFCEPQAGDTNKRRWPVAGWWADFVGSLKRGMSLVPGEPVEHSIEAARQWLEKQVMPWQAAVVQAEGGEVNWLYDAMVRARRRWKPHHYAAMRAARAVPVA